MAKEFTTKNGATIIINEAPFADAIALKNAAERAIKSTGVNLKLDDNIESLIGIVLALDSDDEVFKKVFKCLERSLCNKQKITLDIFEESAMRENYYEIIVACLEVNLLPFFKALFSTLATLQNQQQNLLKSKSEQAN
jgi:hypothetical protein